MTIDAVCSQCGKDMEVQPQGDFVRLTCECGNHKLVNIRVLKGKDTQPIPPITRSMSEEEIHEARKRMLTEDTRDGFSGEQTLCSYYDGMDKEAFLASRRRLTKNLKPFPVSPRKG